MSKRRWLVPVGITLALTAGLTYAARRSFRSLTPMIHREVKKEKSEPREGTGDGSPGEVGSGRDMSGAGAGGEGIQLSQQESQPAQKSGTWTFSDKWFSRYWLSPSQAVLEDAMLDQFEMEDYSGGDGDYQH